MGAGTTATRSVVRRMILPFLLALGLIAQGPAAYAATTYVVTRGAGVYVAGTTRVTPTGVFIDASVYRLSTTSAVPFRMPWPVRVYGNAYSSMWVSTKGNIQFGPGSPTSTWVNTCLPSATIPGVAVLPYWDDIKYTVMSEGIFTRAYTENGVQKFVVSWRGRHYSTEEPIRAEVIFTRNSSNFEFRYADGFAGSATIGVQKSSRGPRTQYTCNTGTNRVDAGLRLSFRFV
jgi:hypothetical protein